MFRDKIDIIDNPHRHTPKDVDMVLRQDNLNFIEFMFIMNEVRKVTGDNYNTKG